MASECPDAQREQSGSARTRAAFPNLALLVAATLFSLLFAEIAVRALGLAPSIVPIAKGRFRLSPNLKIGYEPIPNLEYDGDSLRFFQYRGTSNELGYRGPIYSEVKSPDTYRIVVLGDSVSFFF